MVVESVNQVKKALATYRPKRNWVRRFCRRSAVAMLLRQAPDDGLEVLMIKRAERIGDPWSGHMAFPGGHLDADDEHALGAARRETWEEIGLDTHRYTQQIGRLSDVFISPFSRRKPMVITPYVFEIVELPELNLNHEVDRIVWVPISFVADPQNRQTMQWQRQGKDVTLPCYWWQQHRIWGLSLGMLDELLLVLRGISFDVRSRR